LTDRLIHPHSVYTKQHRYCSMYLFKQYKSKYVYVNIFIDNQITWLAQDVWRWYRYTVHAHCLVRRRLRSVQWRSRLGVNKTNK